LAVSKRAVVDTGPLVAVIRRREAAHEACVDALKQLRSPPFTCWPVITEVSWLLRNEPGGIRAVARLVQSGVVRLVDLDEPALISIVNLMERYASAGVQLADAALLFIADREQIDTILTLDRRDFTIVRTSSGRAQDILPGV
jgi:predicted nucleic acid-binding protein